MMTAVGYRTSPRCPLPHSKASEAEHLGCSDLRKPNFHQEVIEPVSALISNFGESAEELVGQIDALAAAIAALERPRAA